MTIVEASINVLLENYFFSFLDEGGEAKDAPLVRHSNGDEDITEKVMAELRLTRSEAAEVIEAGCKDIGALDVVAA